MDRFFRRLLQIRLHDILTPSASAGLPSLLADPNQALTPPPPPSFAATAHDYPALQPLLITRRLCCSEPGVPRFNDMRRAMNMNPIKKWSDLTKNKEYQVGVIPR